MNALGKLPLLLLCLVLLTGCACQLTPRRPPRPRPLPHPRPPPAARAWSACPKAWRLGLDGAPLVDVFVVENQAVEQMDMESYLAGVLAGEMQGDWPLEALKAQALLARTFALRFLLDRAGPSTRERTFPPTLRKPRLTTPRASNDNILAAIEQTPGVGDRGRGGPAHQGLVPRPFRRPNGHGQGRPWL